MPFKGSIPNDYLVHLLCQGHNQFAGDAAFIFTACNQRMRHETLTSVSCKAKRNPSSMEQLGKLTKDPLFAKKVSTAVACPDGKEAKEVLQMFQNVLKNSGASVPYSPFESASAVSKVHAMCQWYGCPSVFITITVDDAHNCLGLCMCFPIANYANSQFPCPETDVSEFLCALAQGDEVFRDKLLIESV